MTAAVTTAAAATAMAEEFPNISHPRSITHRDEISRSGQPLTPMMVCFLGERIAGMERNVKTTLPKVMEMHGLRHFKLTKVISLKWSELLHNDVNMSKHTYSLVLRWSICLHIGA